MNFTRRFKISVLLVVLSLAFNLPATACDDTLVMLLTAQNPSSEFSKVIRAFTNSLTVLGTALKTPVKANFDGEMAAVMDAWLEFSKKYMTNPPEEARNDLNWARKTSDTARIIGDIRRLISEYKYHEAHNLVLDLSSRIGTFFEAFGVSDEKQLFIKTSTNLTSLERLLLQADFDGATACLAELRNNHDEFLPMLPETASAGSQIAAGLIAGIARDLAAHSDIALIDKKVQELKASFEELRSHILMREWFPALDQKTQEKK